MMENYPLSEAERKPKTEQIEGKFRYKQKGLK